MDGYQPPSLRWQSQGNNDENSNPLPMNQAALEAAIGDLSDLDWFSEIRSQARIYESDEDELISYEFIVAGKDLSDTIDLANTEIKVVGNSESTYEGSGYEWTEMTIVFSDGNEVSVDGADQLEEWLTASGHIEE